jgi:YegS/Rv2252/BmrU family lipid kinase
MKVVDIMKCKSVCLIINPRLGQNVSRIADLLAVFSAAGWKTKTVLKEFGGHAEELAKKAAEAGHDLVIAYGGDGTLNQVVNGVMAAERSRTIVGVLPGGTANVWAHEIGLPEDPVKAALLLINSEGRRVDLGHVQVDTPPLGSGTKGGSGKAGLASVGRHHFLLMAGLGADATVLGGVSTQLKEEIGGAAVALAAAEKLPSQHAFPIEIRSSVAGGKGAVRWEGKALQVIVGNTRRYGNIAEATPEAFIDDGVLDVCVITAGAPLTTIQQILSTLLHREGVKDRSEYLQGAHFRIRVPASVGLQVDGSVVKLHHGTPGPGGKVPGPAEPSDGMMVTYRFDAMPLALRAAIPCVYDNALFEDGAGKDGALVPPPAVPEAAHAPARGSAEGPDPASTEVSDLLARGLKVVVVGVGPNPARKGAYIIAGNASDLDTGEPGPVAVRIVHDTTVFGSTGEPLPPDSALKLLEGGVIVVEGKKSKRSVIRAKRIAVR